MSELIGSFGLPTTVVGDRSIGFSVGRRAGDRRAGGTAASGTARRGSARPTAGPFLGGRVRICSGLLSGWNASPYSSLVPGRFKLCEIKFVNTETEVHIVKTSHGKRRSGDGRWLVETAARQAHPHQ